MKQLLYLSLKSPCPYTTSSKIQESWVHRFLLNKQYPDTYIKPPALLLVAQFYPTYTCGRRENNSICPSDIKYLETNPTAIFIKTLRGGQITFHGPGQIVGYPILDLKDFKACLFAFRNITPKEYVNRLESSIISTCKVFGIAAMRTEHTGFTSVWTSPIRKIASIGIHLRRHITSHGIALNVSTDLSYFKKIIACGLKGKEMTSFEREGVYVPLEIVESCWIKNLANQLGCTINRINPEQIGDILLNQ